MNDLDRKQPTALDGGEIFLGQPPFAERRRQQIGDGDRVLHRKVDPDAADRRHRVGRIADRQESRLAPTLEPIDHNRQQLQRVEAGNLVEPRARQSRQPGDIVLEGAEAPRAKSRVRILSDDIAALPIGAAIDADEDAPIVDTTDQVGAVALAAR
ncbi:MAG TPA: hypothetical protein VEC58_00425 [Roseiarcus sp.]|nr:hypothetical protein [Roseiarcus sp.]